MWSARQRGRQSETNLRTAVADSGLLLYMLIWWPFTQQLPPPLSLPLKFNDDPGIGRHFSLAPSH